MPLDIATRLSSYGLSHAEVGPALTNLTVPHGQKMRLTRADPNMASHVKHLAPTRVADLRRIMGAPDPAVARPRPAANVRNPVLVSSVLSPQLTAVEWSSLWRSAHNVVFGNMASVNPSQIATINQWLTAVNPAIFVHLYQDITVEMNAQLILAPDVSVLFANHILIQKGGQIICQGARIKFDCASLTGVDGPPSPGTGTGT
jgi:hypothetical protein